MTYNDIIRKKRDGGELTESEINYLISGVVSGDMLDACGDIEVTVANTSLNEIKATEKLMENLPRAERGPYLERLAVHEERVPKLKFGKVIIEKLM